MVAKDRMALLELLSKTGLSGDVGFLREGVQVLAQALMDPDASRRIGRSRKRGRRDVRPTGTGIGTGSGTPGSGASTSRRSTAVERGGASSPAGRRTYASSGRS